MPAPTSPMGQLLAVLAELPDPRYRRRPEHRLMDILVIALCSTLCGGRGFTDMKDFGLAWEQWLRSHLGLKLPAGIPSLHTFRRVLSALDPHSFAGVFRQWAAGVPALLPPPPQEPDGPGLRQLAVDGKVVRGSRCRGDDPFPVMLINAWLVDCGVCLGQRRVPPGCTETVQLPFLLRQLCLDNTLVTADAAHTQPDTASLITARGGDWLLCVKGNQPATLRVLKAHFADAGTAESAESASGHGFLVHESVEKGHGRIDTRRCTVSHDVASLPVRGLWSGLAAVARVETESTFPGTERKPRRAVRYFICSTALSAERMALAVRSHWHVENKLHWVLDMDFGEDAHRARTGWAAASLSHLRKIALNLLRLHPGIRKNMSLRSKMFVASIKPDFLLALLVPLAPKNS